MSLFHKDFPQSDAVFKRAMEEIGKLGISESDVALEFARKLAHEGDAEEHFFADLRTTLEKKPIAGVDLEDEATHDAIQEAFEMYYIAFCQKLALGEVYSKAHPETRGRTSKNPGYRLGCSFTDLATDRVHHAILGGAEDDDGQPLFDDKTQIQLLGRVINTMLHATTTTLWPPEEDLIEPQLLKVEPQLIHHKGSMESFVEDLRLQPFHSARTWADTEFIDRLEASLRTDGLLPPKEGRARSKKDNG